MARYTGPKNKLSRREGTDLFDKGMKLRRLTIPPGIHGPKMRSKKLSDYGQQLREKQKVRRMYGILEKQFRKYIADAEKAKGATGQSLIQLLEGRIDNVLYRSGLFKTRAMARQFVVHGHVNIDGKKVDRPSYQVQTGQTITLSEKAIANPDVVSQMQKDDVILPKWLVRKAGVVKKQNNPSLEDLDEGINLSLIIEFYSR